MRKGFCFPALINLTGNNCFLKITKVGLKLAEKSAKGFNCEILIMKRLLKQFKLS